MLDYLNPVGIYQYCHLLFVRCDAVSSSIDVIIYLQLGLVTFTFSPSAGSFLAFSLPNSQRSFGVFMTM